MRKPRLSLETWRGRNCSNLAGCEQSDNSNEGHQVQLFEAAICAARNIWDIRRRSGGLFAIGRLTKADAEAALRKALTALKAEAC